MDFQIEGLTEEQNKKLQSEIDRRVTDAVQTTTKRVTEEVTKQLSATYEQTYQQKLNEAVSAATQSVTMTEAQKIEALTKQLNEQKMAFEKSQLQYRTEQKLRDAGISQDAIAALTPVFVNATDSSTLDATLDSFITTQKAAIATALQEQQQKLALGATPSPTGNPTTLKADPNAQIKQILADKNLDDQYATASAVQCLLNAQA